jgi:hypothetical protein
LQEFIAFNAAADFSAQEAHPEWFGGEAQPTGDDAIDGRFRKLCDCLSYLHWVAETSEYSRTRNRKLADAGLAASSLEEMLEWREYDPAETACLMWMAWAFSRGHDWAL